MHSYIVVLHASTSTMSIYFRPEPKQVQKKAPRSWNIAVMQTMLGEDICRNILFIRALLGTDTTSSLYEIGKISKPQTDVHISFVSVTSEGVLK